jgi:hypothetical protein
MTPAGSNENGTNNSGAPIDFARLDATADRLSGDSRFANIVAEPPVAPEQLRCVYVDRLYPASVETARIEFVWFENGDFSIHYHETHRSGSFDHRWDRHPSTHNTRDHIHPGPDASTPGRDASHPQDWRDMLSTVLTEIDRRQRELWPE